MIDYEIDGKTVEKKKENFALFLHLFLSVCPFSPFLFLSGPRFSHAV
jgi:hypothetical protein